MATERRYYIGPWILKQSERGEYYDAPEYTVGRVDLRGKSNSSNTYGFFATDRLLSNSDYIYLGDGLYNDLSGAQMEAWKTLLGMSNLNGTKLLDVLWDTLTENADPEGEQRAYPIIPTHNGQIELYLGGHSLIKSRVFKGITDPAWPNIQKVLRKDFKEITASVGKTSDLPAKSLGAWKLKFKISDESLFIPDDMDKSIKAKKPETSVSDNFNRADGAIGTNWTAHIGNFTVSSNAVLPTGGAMNVATFNTELSSSDNYSESVCSSYSSGPDSGLMCRYNSGAYYAYWYENLSSSSGYKLTKFSGTETRLGSYSASTTGARTIKVYSNGSTIKGFVDGVEKVSVTDTTITSGVRVGIHSWSVRGYHDDFLAADLISSSLLAVIMKESNQFNGGMI